MRKYRSSSKSGLFLIELIIAITFFSVASAVCVQLFAQAHLIGKRSADLNNAMTLAQNQAEAFKALTAPEQAGEAPLQERYYALGEDGHLIYLGESALEDARYCVRTKCSGEADELRSLDIQVTKADGEEISLYEITVNSYGEG